MLQTLYLDWKFNPKERKQLFFPIDTFRDIYDKTHPLVIGAIQAWTHSTRFPNKIYAQLNGAPLLYHTINRVALSSYITNVVVVSPEELDVPDGTELFIYKKAVNKDVLSLYSAMADKYEPDYVVRITSDCPVLDPLLVDFVVGQAILKKADFCTNVLDPDNYSFPDGQDIEVMKYSFLRFLDKAVLDKKMREHVTMAFRLNPAWQMEFNTISIENATNYGDKKCSIDTPEDLKKLEQAGL